MAYIKKQDVMKICEEYDKHCFNSNDARGQDIADKILDDVVELPTEDVVEVVRCKDCKYQDECLQKVDYEYRNRLVRFVEVTVKDGANG